MNPLIEALDCCQPDWPVSENAMRWSPPVREPAEENGE